MFNFHGGSTALGTSMTPLSVYAGYMLLHSGNVWIAGCFLVLVSVSFFITATMLCRYVINYRRNKRLSLSV